MTWTDPVTGRNGFAVIDTLVNGIAGGGTRLRAGCSLEEVEGLARAMTLKTATLGVPAGGSKCGLDCDPRDPEATALLVRFVQALRPMFDTCLNTGEDMGTSQELLAAVFAEAGAGPPLGAALARTSDPAAARRRIEEGQAVSVDGIGLVDLVGGFGVAEAAATAMRHLGREKQGATVVIQGFGSMGGSSARYLSRLGARVIAIADAVGTVTDPDGLDVEHLLAHRNQHGEMDRAALPGGARELPRDAWLGLECDLLVPAAMGGVITRSNAGSARCRLVVEAANEPCTEGGLAMLAERGIPVVPDFVANAGTGGWLWWLILDEVEPTAGAAFAKISSFMTGAVGSLFTSAEARGVTLREAAIAVADANLEVLRARYG